MLFNKYHQSVVNFMLQNKRKSRFKFGKVTKVNKYKFQNHAMKTQIAMNTNVKIHHKNFKENKYQQSAPFLFSNKVFYVR